MELALCKIAETHGRQMASVIHLAVYFDCTGEENPLYEQVNENGTGNLLRALRAFDVGQFVYSSTMLVHRPTLPGVPLTETARIDPGWAYPRSKAKLEEIIRVGSGEMPYVLLRLAGLYDAETGVPTLVEQIRRIYERDPKANAYAGSLETGQSFLYREDMIDAFERTVRRRADLPDDIAILVGEPEAVGYGELQERLARLIHDEDDWRTISVPKPVAAAGAWL